MISTIIVRLMLSTARPRRWHICIPVVLFRQNFADLLYLLRFLRISVDRWSQSCVPIYHFFLQGQRLIGDWHLSSHLLAFDDDGSFLNVDQVDLVDCLLFVRNRSFHALWRDHSHGLHNTDAGHFYTYTVSSCLCSCIRDFCARRHCSSWLLNWGFSARLVRLAHLGGCSRALLGLLSRCLL